MNPAFGPSLPDAAVASARWREIAQSPHDRLIVAFVFSIALHHLILAIPAKAPVAAAPATSAHAARLVLHLKRAPMYRPDRPQPLVNERAAPRTHRSSPIRNGPAVGRTEQGHERSERPPGGIEDAPEKAAGPETESGPSIDLDRAKEIARRVSTLPQDSGMKKQHARDSTERPSALERGMIQAIRRDCRTSYADAGLLAVPLLLVDAVRDKGCKW